MASMPHDGDPDVMARELQEPGQALRRVHVVVDDEHLKASSTAASRRLFGEPPAASGGASAAGSRRTNSLPLPGPSLVAVMVPPCISARRPYDRQPDAQAPLRAGERAVRLGEQVEEPGEHLGGDPDPVVPDPDDHLAVLDPGGELDASTRRGVLGGVGQEVHEDLLEPRRVGLELQARWT